MSALSTTLGSKPRQLLPVQKAAKKPPRGRSALPPGHDEDEKGEDSEVGSAEQQLEMVELEDMSGPEDQGNEETKLDKQVDILGK